jgi:hypothetical protein
MHVSANGAPVDSLRWPVSANMPIRPLSRQSYSAHFAARLNIRIVAGFYGGTFQRLKWPID